MNTPIKTVGKTQTAQPTEFHRLASYIGGGIESGAKLIGGVAKAFGKSIIGRDDYTQSLRKNGKK